MTDSWVCCAALNAERRLEVLSLLDRTETRLGREAIDEGRRRTVVHGWPAEHWLHYEHGNLSAYAMVNGAQHAVVEMCGGGVDAHLLGHLISSHDSLDWWVRDLHGDLPMPAHVLRTLHLMQVVLPVAAMAVPDDATLYLLTRAVMGAMRSAAVEETAMLDDAAFEEALFRMVWGLVHRPAAG